jgi:hypothetical protein
MPDIKPTKGAPTETAIDQARMVVPAVAEEPGLAGETDAKGGGEIYTCAFSETETRPQDMHGSVNYQKTTADPGSAPPFIPYTGLTEAKGKVRG